MMWAGLAIALGAMVYAGRLGLTWYVVVSAWVTDSTTLPIFGMVAIVLGGVAWNEWGKRHPS